MKIAIDAKAALGNKTGKGVYAYNIIREMVAHKKHQFFIYVPDQEDPFIEELAKHTHVEVRIIGSKGFTWHRQVTKDIKSLYREGKLDAYFSPSSFIVPYLLHFSEWFSFGKKTTPDYYITVHDLVAFLYYKDHDAKAVGIEQFTLLGALKGAKHVFAVSENTKYDITKRFKTPAEKISITYNAVADHFTKFRKNETALKKLRKKYKLPKKYILALGTLVPRKNFTLVLQAFEIFAEEDPETDLVIVGGEGWGRTANHVVKKAQKNPRIHWLGYVPYEDLPAIYAVASVFIYPSYYEGFGIPPLEAMAVGCPVITSNTSSLPEVVGGAAIKIDPTDAIWAASAMKKFIEDPLHRAEYTRKGHKNVRRFSWKQSAKAIIDKISERG